MMNYGRLRLGAVTWPPILAWIMLIMVVFQIGILFLAKDMFSILASVVRLIYVLAIFVGAVLVLTSGSLLYGRRRVSAMLMTTALFIVSFVILFQFVAYIVRMPRVNMVTEALFLLAYLLAIVAIGAYFEWSLSGLGSVLGVVLDSIIIGYSAFLLISDLLPKNDPLWAPHLDGYLTIDMAMLFAIIAVISRYGRSGGPAVIIGTLSILCLVAADIVFTYSVYFSPLKSGLQAAPLYSLTGVLIGLAYYRSVHHPPQMRQRSFDRRPWLDWFLWVLVPRQLIFIAFVKIALSSSASPEKVLSLFVLGVAHEIMAMVDYHRVNQHLHQQKETAEEMLRQLHRAKDELKQWLDVQATEVVSVAHDLARYSRDIFVALAWFKRTMMSTSQDDHQTIQIFERRVNVALRDQRRLLENMQDAARIQGPGLPQHPQAIDLVELITPLVEHFQDAALGESNPCSLTLHVSPDLPLVWGDPDLLWRVVSNIIDNGLKYTREVRADGEVQVGLSAEAAWVICQVADNGKGIAPHDQARLGQRWARVAVGDHTPGGMGLGLSFCKAVIDASGGILSFQSQLGVGTTVTIQLPRAPHSAIQPTMVSPMSLIAGFTFLIVEDTSIGNELASLLQTQGASATVVMMTAAQQWLQEQVPSAPHVAIIDYHLPGSVSGTTFAAWVQQQPHLQSTLRISWSALPRESICAGWVDNPHDPLYHGFIRKSSELAEVTRRLGNMVHHYALNAHLRNGNHVEA